MNDTQESARHLLQRRETLSVMIDKAHASFDRCMSRGQIVAARRHLERAERLMATYDGVLS